MKLTRLVVLTLLLSSMPSLAGELLTSDTDLVINNTTDLCVSASMAAQFLGEQTPIAKDAHTMRVVTYNTLHGGIDSMDAARVQSSIEAETLWSEEYARRLQEIVEFLRYTNADIIAFQELMHWQLLDYNIADEVARALGMNYVLGPQMEWGEGHLALGIFSRYEIIEAEVLTSDWEGVGPPLLARLALPDGSQLAVVNLHGWGPPGLPHDTMQLVDLLPRFALGNTIVLGDFNNRERDLSPALTKAGGWTHIAGLDPDQIYVSTALASHAIEPVELQEGLSSTAIPDVEYLSDHLPQMMELVFEEPIAIESPREVLSLELVGTDMTSVGASDGSIDLNVIGGMLPFAYSWAGPDGFAASTEDVSGLIAGTYEVVATDVNGCSERGSLTLASTQDPSAGAVLRDEVTVVEEGMGSFHVEAYVVRNQTDGTDEYHYILTNIDYCGAISWFGANRGGIEALERRCSRGWGALIEGDMWVWEGRPGVEPGGSCEFTVVVEGPLDGVKGAASVWALSPCPSQMARFETIIPGGPADTTPEDPDTVTPPADADPAGGTTPEDADAVAPSADTDVAGTLSPPTYEEESIETLGMTAFLKTFEEWNTVVDQLMSAEKLPLAINGETALVEEAGQRFHRVLDKTIIDLAQGGLRGFLLDLDIRFEGASLGVTYRKDQDVPLQIAVDREAESIRVIPGGLWNPGEPLATTQQPLHLKDGQWHHLTIVQSEEGALKVYLDTQLILACDVGQTQGASELRLWINTYRPERDQTLDIRSILLLSPDGTSEDAVPN